MNIKHIIVDLATRAVKLLPFSAGLYAIAKSYTDYFDGNNNMDCRTNGESFFLQAIAPACNAVCDAGANEGHWAEKFLEYSPSATLHLFEPNHACASILREKFKTRGRRIFVNEVALTDACGDAHLHYWDHQSQVSSLFFQDTLGVKALPPKAIATVNTDTLDSYCTKNKVGVIDFLKIDTEGAEMSVLTGARTLMQSRRIRYIQLEYHATWIYARFFLRDVFLLAETFGYSIYKLLNHGRLLQVDNYSQQLDVFQYSNWVLVRPGELVPGRIIKRALE